MEAVVAALDAFAALQAKHLAALAAGKINDLRDWCMKREQAFRRLQLQLDAFGSSAAQERDQGTVTFFRTRLAEILAGEQLLKEAAGAARQSTSERLQALRKGKKMLRGYSPRQRSARGPSVVSSKT